ncbi:MAG: carboxylating nicotinate-nucleotide diphosphorylase [Candidatus Mcinerneyibacterium aminivorans]|uniref:Probable nicotinate-nucleotide pyrophosphorylase [carboxylating] n=1 Tax=Candidatus Mcinerneyibacterium aminivorans TaxID=2703815 RepID=A0A5D0M9B3_9BACT|nr:MAG: carboxylating nicotinate-nucleotide diphosphorylase [Candidatus Mcinerneyibacterium aminivorans]
MGLNPDKILHLIDWALKEDLGENLEDITTDNLSADIDQTAVLINKEPLVVAGIKIVEYVYKRIDDRVEIRYMVEDGEYIKNKKTLVEIKGRASSLLKGERIALNFFQRMCGIATKTRDLVKHLNNKNIKIADTRKTVPGYRYIDKYSVRMGGGINHRLNLNDMVMIKDNHKSIEGGLKKAYKKIKNSVPLSKKIDVEVETIYEAEEAAKLGADIIMLDNMTNEQIKKSAKIIRGINENIIIEVSGGIDRNRLRGLTDLDIDVISMGALTHSVSASDISMKISN